MVPENVYSSTMRLFLFLLLGFCFLQTGKAEMYIWTDANGAKHVTDTPPPRDAKNTKTIKSSPKSISINRPEKHGVRAEIYTFPECSSNGEVYFILNRQAIPYKEFDLKKDSGALKSYLGYRENLPVIVNDPGARMCSERFLVEGKWRTHKLPLIRLLGNSGDNPAPFFVLGASPDTIDEYMVSIKNKLKQSDSMKIPSDKNKSVDLQTLFEKHGVSGEIYTVSGCSENEVARSLLSRHNIPFKEFDIQNDGIAFNTFKKYMAGPQFGGGSKHSCYKDFMVDGKMRLYELPYVCLFRSEEGTRSCTMGISLGVVDRYMLNVRNHIEQYELKK